MLFVASILFTSLHFASFDAPALRQAPTTAPAASVSPASEAASSYNANDLDTLRAKVGSEVEITGTPTGTGHSKSGNVFYLNFAGAHKAVALVFFAGTPASGADTGAKKAQSEEDLKTFVGKAISVSGKLADYKGDLQIVVKSLDQIKVTSAP